MGLKELMLKREDELVASGFIEKRIDLSNCFRTCLDAFYYEITRYCELNKDLEYNRLSKSYMALKELEVFQVS